MSDLSTRLTSRKFLAMVAAVLAALLGMFDHLITPDQAAQAIMTTVVGYMVAEGAVDAVRAAREPQAPVEEPVAPTPRASEAAPVAVPPTIDPAMRAMVREAILEAIHDLNETGGR